MLWLAFTSHSAFAQWHRGWGRHHLNQTEISRADGLSGAFKTKSRSDRHERALAAAFRHFETADRWGLAGVVEVKLGLAWCYVLRGDVSGAQRLAGEAVALAPDQPALRQNLSDLEHAAASPVGERFARAAALAAAGELEAAAIEFQACVALAPESAAARFNLGGVLRRLGHNTGAIEQFEAARRLTPEDADVSVELGLAYQAIGENDKALDALKRAVTLNPDSPESKFYLSQLITELEKK